MNIFTEFRSRIVAAVDSLDIAAGDGFDLSKLGVEPPRDPSHGDIATNAALVLTKQAGVPPRELASRLADALAADPDVEAATVAGPGFVNLKISDGFWRRELAVMLAEGGDYGRSSLGEGSKVNVEYVSANPTGPMHVGHCRGAVVGDTLANLLAFAGYEVTKEYYINDAGVQIDVLARSVLLRYREALGEAIGAIPEGLYPGDYLVPVGKALAEEFSGGLLEMPEGEALAIVRDRSIDAMMALIREDLAALNVHHDVFFSERDLHADGAKRIRTAINDLTMKGHVYKGKLPPPKGQLPEDWEDREQTLFRSTAVGDDIDRPLIKSDGSYTYFAADVAYFIDKYRRGYGEMIYVLGADHGGYVKRLEALARAVSGGETTAHRAAVPVGQAVPGRRTGSHVEAGGAVRDPARRGRRGRPRSGPLHDALPQERRAAGFRFRQGDRAVEGQSGLLRAICERPVPLRVPAGGGAVRRACRTRREQAGPAHRYRRDRTRQEAGGISEDRGGGGPHPRAAPNRILSLRSCQRVPCPLEPRHRYCRLTLC